MVKAYTNRFGDAVMNSGYIANNFPNIGNFLINGSLPNIADDNEDLEENIGTDALERPFAVVSKMRTLVRSNRVGMFIVYKFFQDILPLITDCGRCF